VPPQRANERADHHESCNDYPLHLLPANSKRNPHACNVRPQQERQDKDPADGLAIRFNSDRPLEHKCNGVGEGEYVNDFSIDPVSGILRRKPNLRNEPALYAVKPGNLPQRSFKIKVRFVAPYSSATISARPSASNPIKLPLVKPRVVNFKLLPNGLNVSFENNSEYVEFDVEPIYLAGTEKIDKIIGTWIWDEENVNGTGTVKRAIATSTHTIYTVLDVPQLPWYDQGRENTRPWVKALDYTIKGGPKTENLAQPAAVMNQLTQFDFTINDMEYDTVTCQANFVKGAATQADPTPSLTGLVLDFNRFIDFSQDAIVNCQDCSASINTMAALVGVATVYVVMKPYGVPSGFMKQSDLIGWGQANHPMFFSPTFSPRQIWVLGDPKPRSAWNNHAFVMQNNEVYCATVGPYISAVLGNYINGVCENPPPPAPQLFRQGNVFLRDQ